MISKRKSVVVLLSAMICCTGMMGEQCQQSPTAGGLEGLWALERGAVTIRVTHTVNNGGVVDTTTNTSNLEPLNPDDFPPALAELVAQWNAGLNDLNASLDEALPDVVGVEFPQFGTMRIFDPDAPAMQGNGLFNGDTLEYLFVGDLSGAGMGDELGGGGVLQASAVGGQFDAMALTTSGEIGRTLLVTLLNTTGGVAFSVEITVAYTGQRTGDMPAMTDADANMNSSDG